MVITDYFTPQGQKTRRKKKMSTALVQTTLHLLCVHVQMLVFLLTFVFVCDTLQPTESIKEIMKMCATLLTVVWSSEYYGSHYEITKPTWQATHQPTQTVHGKQHLIPSLTAHHCLLEGYEQLLMDYQPL